MFHKILWQKSGRLAALLLMAASSPAAAQSGDWTFSRFVSQLVDLERLSRIEPSNMKMISSFDRSGGNDDGFNPGWLKNGTYTIAEIEGPGVIRRMWTARPEGIFHVYLDGNPKAVIEMPTEEFFAGRRQPFERPLVGPMGGGNYCYFPIPFARSIKIQITPRQGGSAAAPYGAYHHVTYERFPAGTAVRSLRLPLAPAELEDLARVSRLWRNPGSDPKRVLQEQTTFRTRSEIAAEASVRLCDLTGPAVIDRIHLRIEPSNPSFLRGLLIRIQWDDQTSPAVDCPVGDFFGNGFSFVPYASLPMGLTSDGFYCYFPMPFARRARIFLWNQGSRAPVTADLSVVYHKTGRMDPRAGYFHAKWRREEVAGVDMQLQNKSAEYNYRFLDVRGQGRYLGANLNVVNRHFYWWGEGDPMIFVDNEKWPPSVHGTGTEEYFNDAWGFHDYIFAPGSDPKAKEKNVNATSGVLLPGIGAGQYWGPNAVFVFHLADSVTFRERLLATIEHDSENGMTNDYASTAYWYALPGAKDFFVMRPVEERRVPAPEEWEPRRRIELEKFGVEMRRDLAGLALEIPERATDQATHRPRVRLLRRLFANAELLGLPKDDRDRLQKEWNGARELPMPERWPVMDRTLMELARILAPIRR